MPDDKPVPTEEQVKAANEAEDAKWQGDFKDEDLAVPYKREADNDDKDEENSDEADNDDSDKESDVEDTQAEQQPVVTESVVTVEDPGEYKPADHSFEVTLADGKSHKISTVEEAEKLAEDADNFETPKQLLDFIRKSEKMERQLDKDYEKWEAQHETFTIQLETETQRREQVDSYVGEFSYLVGKGLLPKISAEDANADWVDAKTGRRTEVASHPGVKEQMALLDYMEKENGIRKEAGIKPLSSIVDAFNAWQLDTGRQKDEADTKAAGEARKAAASRVASVSPAAQPGVTAPKGIAVGRVMPQRGAAMWDD